MRFSIPSCQIKPAAIPIIIYSTVQTGPNIQLGGLKEGLLIFTYQSVIEEAVAKPDKKPIREQAMTLIMILDKRDFVIVKYR